MVYVFNPPTASEMPDNEAHEPELSPYSLHRQMLRYGSTTRMRREARRVNDGGRLRNVYDGPEHYYVDCRRARMTRSRCTNEIEVYRVVTGTKQVENNGHVTEQELHTYYWPDAAIVIETAMSPYAVRPVQLGFCSWKCAAAYAAKLARDTE